MLTVAEAKERILARATRTAVEEVPINEALGRILGRAIVAGRDLPPWDNSAMDGFAVRAEELPGELPVRGTIAAGSAPTGILERGTTQRIMTGAPMPRGANAVVMREEVDDRGDSAVFAERPREAQHIRRAGEDVRSGDEVLESGLSLGPGELGMLAAQGFASVPVAVKPRVAILSTGDELVDVDVEPAPGQIVNSNAYALAAQVREAGGEPIVAGIAPDDRELLIEAIASALEADVLLTSGGVSVGDFDFVKEAFEAVGVEMDFWKVAMKPGKPLAFGVGPKGTMVFGLPGNPGSSMTSFELFARPTLLAMQGARTIDRPRTRVVLEAAYKKKPGRAHFVKTRIRRDGDNLIALARAKQGSGMLSSNVGIDGYLELDRDCGDLEAGSSVTAMLFRPL